MNPEEKTFWMRQEAEKYALKVFEQTGIEMVVRARCDFYKVITKWHE